MFDGNHRAKRREINLSRGSTRSSRHFHNRKRTASTNVNSSSMGSTSSTPPSTSALNSNSSGSSALSATREIRSAADVLEEARRKREARRLTHLQYNAAVRVQKVWRGFAKRRHVAGGLFVEWQGQSASFAKWRRFAGVLRLRLSNALLGYWPAAAAANGTDCCSGSVLEVLLQLAQLLQNPQTHKLQQQEQDCHQWKFVALGIARQALYQLLHISHSSSSSSPLKSNNTELQNAHALAGLVETLSQTVGEPMEEAAGTHGFLMDLALGTTTLKKGTQGGDEVIPMDVEEPSQDNHAIAPPPPAGVQQPSTISSTPTSTPAATLKLTDPGLLYAALQPWLYASSSSTTTTNTTTTPLSTKTVAEKLLQLAQTTVHPLLHSTTNKNTTEEDAVLAIHAAVLLGTPHLSSTLPNHPQQQQLDKEGKQRQWMVLVQALVHAMMDQDGIQIQTAASSAGTMGGRGIVRLKSPPTPGYYYSLITSSTNNLDGGRTLSKGSTNASGNANTNTNASASGTGRGRELTILSNTLHFLWTPTDPTSSSSAPAGITQATACATVVLRLLALTLTQRPDLAQLAGWVACKGSAALDAILLAKQDSGLLAGVDKGEEEESSGGSSSEEEDEDGGYEDQDQGPHSQSLQPQPQQQQQPQPVRLKRGDYSTTKGLDLLIQKEHARQSRTLLAQLQVQLQQKNTGDANKQREEAMELVELAKWLGQGDHLLQLGKAVQVWSTHDSPSNDNNNNNNDNNNNNNKVDAADGEAQVEVEARNAYCHILFHLLSSGGGGGLKATSSQLLSQLAFAPRNAVAVGLWRTFTSRQQQLQLQRQQRSGGGVTRDAMLLATLAAFCDVLSHRLLAVDDEEFWGEMVGRGVLSLNDDLSMKMDVDGPLIAVEDVVPCLNKALYELYWDDPVLSSDVSVASSTFFSLGNSSSSSSSSLSSSLVSEVGYMRLRLFLAGTKLYNALYERWCRLEHPFCEEGAWWWPKLVSSSVRRTAPSNHNNRGFGGVGMRGPTAAAAGGVGIAEDVVLRDVAGTAGDTTMGIPTEEDDEDGMDQDHIPGTSSGLNAQDAENEALAASFRDPKMARVLTGLPQAVPFERRVALFHSLLEADKTRTQDEMVQLRNLMMMRDAGGMMNHPENENVLPGRVQVKVRRDEIYQDSMKQLNQLGSRLREKVMVTLINKHGTEEAGIDGGGVFKEFLDDLIKDAFAPANNQDMKKEEGGSGGGSDHAALFAASPVETLYVNPGAFASVHTNKEEKIILEQYEFLGRVLGKAVYESILVEPQFSLPFLNLLLGRQNTLDDLKRLDPEVYRHLRSLRRMPEEEVSSLGLTFEVTSTVNARGQSLGGLKTIPLVRHGASMPVTKANAIQYVHLVANHKLNVEGSLPTRAFLRGFRDLIPAPWVRLFSARELQKLISGDDAIRGIDVEGMKRVMQYAGGYHPSQPIIQWFWDVVQEFTPEQQRKFLKFMTSCSRQPLLGFQALVPLPCIQQVRVVDHGRGGGGGRRGGLGAFFGGGHDSDEEEHPHAHAHAHAHHAPSADVSSGKGAKLPTSSTCMNLLKLPKYDSKEVLREKLLYSIEAGAGFELT